MEVLKKLFLSIFARVGPHCLSKPEVLFYQDFVKNTPELFKGGGLTPAEKWENRLFHFL